MSDRTAGMDFENSANSGVWIRELSPEEFPMAGAAKTGDVLADGSVLLWQEDMNRMGLQKLTNWILEKVFQEKATIVLGSVLKVLRPDPILDEMALTR